MPVPITPVATRSLARHCDEALTLVRDEFDGLDRDRQYRKAFARLMETDPNGRVLVLGTDDPDHVVPVLRETIGCVLGPGGHVLDLGGGDGKTFRLLADRLPARVVVSVLEPSTAALHDYSECLAVQTHIVPGALLETTFDTADRESALPADGSVDLVLAIHMLYFVRDPEAALLRMARLLAPGAALCVAASAGMRSYTEQVLEAFVAGGGDFGDKGRRLRAIAEREALLSGGVRELLASRLPGLEFEVDAWRLRTRLYGHTLGDLIALADISELAEVDGPAKFEAAARLLRSAPECVDLRVEDDGPRMGMWSVAHPQYLTIIRRRSVGSRSSWERA